MQRFRVPRRLKNGSTKSRKLRATGVALWRFWRVTLSGVAATSRAACVCGVLAFAAGAGCSVYDRSLSTAGPEDPEAAASDAWIALDTSDDSSAVDALPPVEERAEDDAPDQEGSQDAGASPEDVGARFDVADATPENADAHRERPTGVTLAGTPSPSGQQAPTTSGSAFSQSCMPNEVVIGYSGTMDGPDASVPVLRTFRALCASLSITGTTTFAVTTTTAETLAVVGTRPGPAPQLQVCGNNEMVVGFGGRSGSDIDQIAIICAPLNISGAAPAFVLSIGNTNMRPGLGGQGGASFAAINCPSGMVAVGNEGRAAYTINSFGLLCRTPTLAVQ
jgi:hypothetical protein